MTAVGVDRHRPVDPGDALTEAGQAAAAARIRAADAIVTDPQPQRAVIGAVQVDSGVRGLAVFADVGQ
ncbi:hypothetical protein [Candidatus Frankia nodulisporulans]|uniref:hypothetical protein n=1 Tax=Candidatus Frankia nodulisporulans TaxID=2060052 RepID=UPI001CDC808A|nr:hypothetical protein [Candidatus Frankia nodulisporulans]